MCEDDKKPVCEEDSDELVSLCCKDDSEPCEDGNKPDWRGKYHKQHRTKRNLNLIPGRCEDRSKPVSEDGDKPVRAFWLSCKDESIKPSCEDRSEFSGDIGCSRDEMVS